MSPRNCISVQVRWMIRRDLKQVLAIENESFEFAWTEDDFLNILRQRNAIGMVAEIDNRIVGMMIYELHKSHLHLLSFAVACEYRRLGVGSQMIDRLVLKLSQQRRQEIVLEVRETNLPAQLFYRSQGFRAIGVHREHYRDSSEDAYVMRFTLPGIEPAPMAPVNRVWHS